MASKYTAYRIVLCGDATDVDQVGVGKLLAAGWELYGQPFVRNDRTVYQVMVKPAAPAGKIALQDAEIDEECR